MGRAAPYFLLACSPCFSSATKHSRSRKSRPASVSRSGASPPAPSLLPAPASGSHSCTGVRVGSPRGRGQGRAGRCPISLRPVAEQVDPTAPESLSPGGRVGGQSCLIQPWFGPLASKLVSALPQSPPPSGPGCPCLVPVGACVQRTRGENVQGRPGPACSSCALLLVLRPPPRPGHGVARGLTGAAGELCLPLAPPSLPGRCGLHGWFGGGGRPILLASLSGDDPRPTLTNFLWLLRQKVQICLGWAFSPSRAGGGGGGGGGLPERAAWKKAGPEWQGCPSPQASPTSNTLPRCEM